MIIFFALLNALAQGAVSESRLNLATDLKVVLSSKPLDTDQIHDLDSQLPNAHLQSWIVSRKTQINHLGLKAIGDGSFVVNSAIVSSIAEVWVRGAGPWYQPWDLFSCRKEVDQDYQNQEGALFAGQVAAHLWVQLFENRKVQIQILFSRLRGPTEETLRLQANLVLQLWLERLEGEWKKTFPEPARKKEWAFYLKEARQRQICSPSKSVRQNRISRPVVAQMEPVGSTEPPIQALLARAPARLWNGLFSIRGALEFGVKKLNARFLVDSGYQQNRVSAEWLESQGIPQERRRGYSFLQKEAVRPLNFEVSNLQMPIREFEIGESAFFDPPETVGSCCDGILGMEFLRLHPMELSTDGYPEIKIWNAKKFSRGPDWSWFEVHENKKGELLSDCVLNGKQALTVIWDLGEEKAFRFTSGRVSGPLAIQCNEVSLGKQLTAVPGPSGASSPQRLQGRAGIPLLRSRFTLDLPHGRIWIPKSMPDELVPRRNCSGVVLRYAFIEGERRLRADYVTPKIKQMYGLKRGTLIAQVDHKPADEMDQWEVDQRLRAYYGPQVTLKWTEKGKNWSQVLEVESSKTADSKTCLP